MKTPERTYTPFKGLKEILERKKFVLKKKDTGDVKTLHVKTDEEIFRDAMADVREIEEFRKIPVEKTAKIRYRIVQTDDSLEELRQIVAGEKKIRISDTPEYIEWVRPRIRKDIAQRLHHGNFSVQDSIDLHGMTLIEAERAFSGFFNDAIKRHLFCIKVIHGRGLRSPNGPVLKEALKRWLCGSFCKWVLAYASAKDCDGGLGATYIILKNR